MTVFGVQVDFKKRLAQPPAGVRGAGRQAGTVHPRRLTLADLPPGLQARVVSFLPGLSSERRAHLQAYGVIPGHGLRVSQHSPVTVVQVEHTELALETALAEQIHIEIL